MNPILFYLPTPWGARPFYSFGVMLGVAIVMGWVLTSQSARRYEPKLNLDHLFNIGLTSALAGLIGARALYVVTHLERFENIQDVIDARAGGMVSYGALLSGAFAAWLSARAYQVSVLRFGDLFSPALAFGLGIGRVGCYLYGCDFGKVLNTNAPTWQKALGSFPRWVDRSGSPAWLHHTQHLGLSIESTTSLAVHPTQLYEALIMLSCVPLTWMMLRRQQHSGSTLMMLVGVYALMRFTLEWLRDDPQRTLVSTPWLTLSLAQWISIACAMLVLGWFMQLRGRRQVEPSSRVSRMD